MPYAFEGGICTDARDGAIEISEKQYQDALAAMTDGKAVSIVDGLKFVDPPPAQVEEPDDPDIRLMAITRRQLRLTLVRNGISLSSVEAAIAAMPEGLPKQEAQIEWADASTFNRNHPTLLLIAGALGLTEAQIDAMWAEAVAA